MSPFRCLLIVACLFTACTGNPVGPGPHSPLKVPTENPIAVMEDAPPPNRPVTGPHGIAPGCLRASELPAVVTWRITQVPVNAVITKAYSHDDSPGCEETTQHTRTQNDHLRVGTDPADPTIREPRFDLDTYDCGHAQVDVSIDGVLALAEVIDYERHCTSPPPPDDPPPPPHKPKHKHPRRHDTA